MIRISHLRTLHEEQIKPTGLADFLLKKDNVFVFGSEAIFAKNTPGTQETGDSIFLLFNKIADNNNIPISERPQTEHDWHILLSDKGYGYKVCENAWNSLNLEKDIEPHISQELSDFLEKGIRKKLIRKIFTTAIDETLELLIRAICLNVGKSLKVYNFKDEMTDQIVAFANAPDEGQVSLVYLFGKIGDKSNNLGKSEIPFVYSENDAMATIVDYIKSDMDVKKNILENIFFNKSIMAIGCRFDDWKFRFFWYSIRGNIDRISNGTVAYTCADPENDPLYRYLSRENGLHIENDSRGFMKTMADMIDSEEIYGRIREKRWKEAHGIFISYASEDLQTASELFYFFVDACGFNSWMDCSNLRPQDRYNEIIRQAIHRCDVFVPILSSQVKKDISANPPILDRYYMKEWKYARSEGKIIVPISVGDYNFKKSYHNIFKEICGFVDDNDIHIKTINDKDEIAEIIRDILDQ